MWTLSPQGLLLLKGQGGERFADFVTRLIYAEAAAGGLAQSEIAGQLRANIRDGGVDIEVRTAIPNDQTGWFNLPTCCQFKAVAADDINAEKKQHKRNDLQDE